MKYPDWRPCLTIVLGIAAACTADSIDTPDTSTTRYVIEAVSPTSIVGVVDTDVSAAPRVRVMDESGTPVPGVVVAFQTEDGTVANAHSFTNANGIASAGRWKLGTQSGEQNLSALVPGLEPLGFIANAVAGPMTKISHAGDEQAARPGTKVVFPVSVLLSDKFNNPVSGQTVTFAIVSGGGSLERPSAVTGLDGRAFPGSWTLGPTTGPQHLKAKYSAPGNPFEVIITAHACDDVDASGCTAASSTCSEASCGEIVFVSSRDGQPEIYSVNRDGTALTRVTNNPAADWDPAWSPDGKRIAFISDRSSYQELYVMNADGTNVVRRTFWARGSSSPSWSPDGKRIVFSSLFTADVTLWSVSPELDGAGPTRFFHPGTEPPGMQVSPDWSPAGNRIAFAYYWDDESCNVGTTDAGGLGFQAITASDSCHTYPSWSRSGSRMTVAFYGAGQAQLGIVNPAGATVQPLVSTGMFTKSSWSPDDEFIVFSSASASGPNLMWIKADGSASGRIVSNGWSPHWRR